MSSRRSLSAVAPLETESEFLIRCQRYEEGALADFFERYHDDVLEFLVARSGEATLAEEVTAETLVRALGLLPRHRNRGAGLGPWLLRVANGRLALRRRPVTKPRPGDPPAYLPPGEGPDAEAARLRSALDLLPPDQQDVLSLRLLGRLPINTVARAMHRGVGATEGLQARGLKNLARLLAPGDAQVAY